MERVWRQDTNHEVPGLLAFRHWTFVSHIEVAPSTTTMLATFLLAGRISWNLFSRAIFPQPWEYPHSWLVYFMENPIVRNGWFGGKGPRFLWWEPPHFFLGNRGSQMSFFGDFGHHQNKYLLEMKYPQYIVGWCETLGHQSQPQL